MESSVDKIHSIFNPFLQERIEKVISEKLLFVHYTTSTAAIQILKNKEFWMRQPACMNDKLELEHGLKCLILCYRDEELKFRESLNLIHPKLAEEVESSFDILVNLIKKDTYLISISEFSEKDDLDGKLSMWRAYGNDGGVAIVMNVASFFTDSDALKSYTYPVFYHKDVDFAELIKRVSLNIRNNLSLLQEQDLDFLKEHVLGAFSTWILTSKHPGFSEEKEWRVIHNPTLEASEYVSKEVISIKSVPQEIYKIILKSELKNNISGLDPDELINRIIVGPSEFPLVSVKAFVELLSAAGVQNAESKVHVSEIPLRK